MSNAKTSRPGSRAKPRGKPGPAGKPAGSPPDPGPVSEALAGLGAGEDILDRLQVYAELLVRWQPRINLVGPETIPDLWRRHMLDSAQLWPLVPQRARSLVDLGSGAGFPGLVLAMFGLPDVHLIERDRRKAVFLRQVSRETRTPVTVHESPIEAVEPFAADVVTARALAPLDRLLPLAARFSAHSTLGLFPKGRQVEKELTCLADWPSIRIDRRDSLSDAAGVILIVRGLGRGRNGDDGPAGGVA
jgi:16S rRNA (guanine527-N7)-methyltransferase